MSTRPGRTAVACALVGLVVVAACVVVAVVTATGVQRTWANLDRSAAGLRTPEGLHEVARLRQGTAWCIISCTNGGEAAVTIVFDANAGTAADACGRLRQSLSEVAGPLEPIDDSGFSCAWQAALPRAAVVRGFVTDADQLQPLSPTGSAGPRWSDAIAVPKGVVAWAEFNSGLE